MISHNVEPRRRHKGRDSRNQIQRFENDASGSVAPAVPETVQKPAVRQGPQTLGGKIPEDGNRYPTLAVDWDEKAFGLTVADCDKKLRDGEPCIEVLTASNPSPVPTVHERKPGAKSPVEEKNRLEIISMTLQPGEDVIVGKRVREILSAARKAAAAPA